MKPPGGPEGLADSWEMSRESLGEGRKMGREGDTFQAEDVEDRKEELFQQLLEQLLQDKE